MSRLLLCFLLLYSIPSSLLYSDDAEIDKIIEFQAQKFKYILETAYKYHPDTLDVVKISDEAFSALLQAMDKESFYYNKTLHKRVQESNKGITYGIGVDIVNIRDTIYIIQITPNSPAQESGIEVGDIITNIDGTKSFGLSKSDTDELLYGDSATYVEISVRNIYDSKIKKLKIQRRDIPQPGVTASYIFPNTNVGVIVISKFSENVAEEFKKSAEELLLKGMQRLLIDVRGNPGGYMTKVDEILDFMIGGSKILTRAVSGSPEYEAEIYSKEGDFLENMPVVVLVDENSASGSELLAGVVQDYDRGIVVGKRSYGKGTVQRIWSMNDTTGFKLTVGKYVTPSGRDIQKYKSDEDFDLDLGLNSSANVEEIKKKISEMGGLGKVDIYKSESGRPLIGGGGVYPDQIVQKDTLTQLTQLLIRRGLYFKWAINFKQKEGKSLLKKYGKDYNKFNLEFLITDEMLREFANFALENNVWNLDMFNQDKTYFITYQKASIANVLWGYIAFSEVLSVVDNQLVAAVLETPKAAVMITK